MRVFGCGWKINFLEIIFSWLGVLKALTRKWFEVKIFTSNHFQTHVHREREREPSTSTSSIYEPITPSTSPTTPSTSSTSPIYEPIFNPEPSTHKPSTSLTTKSLRATNRSSTLHLRPKATNPRTDLSLSLWFLFFVWFWSTHEPLISDFLLLLWWCGWWCFGGFPVV